MTIIDTKNAPGAIGPYSQAYETNGLVITSGQLPVNPADGTMPEGIAAQAEWSCKNVGAILEAAGSGFDKVVKTTCFLADIADFAAFNEVYAKYFTSKPARSCVAVKDLPKGALCEIEAMHRRRISQALLRLGNPFFFNLSAAAALSIFHKKQSGFFPFRQRNSTCIQPANGI